MLQHFDDTTALLPGENSVETPDVRYVDIPGPDAGESSLHSKRIAKNKDNGSGNLEGDLKYQKRNSSRTNSLVLPKPSDLHGRLQLRRLPQGQRAKIEREIEREILSQLTDEQQAIIEQALNIVRETDSRWLVMVFKRVTAVRCRELFRQLGEPERFFEPANGGEYWREAWSDPVLGRQDQYASRKMLGAFITKLLRAFGRNKS
jgi:hypothetical protein